MEVGERQEARVQKGGEDGWHSGWAKTFSVCLSLGFEILNIWFTITLSGRGLSYGAAAASLFVFIVYGFEILIFCWKTNKAKWSGGMNYGLCISCFWSIEHNYAHAHIPLEVMFGMGCLCVFARVSYSFLYNAVKTRIWTQQNGQSYNAKRVLFK